MAGIDFDTIASAKLYISASAPTVAEGAGAAAAFALLTWVEVGQITNVGSVEGREYSTATLSTVGDAQDREKKGSFKLPNAEFECAWAASDAGQILVKAASKDYSVPSFKVVNQDESNDYFTAQVSKFTKGGGTSNDAVKGSMTLLRQTDTVVD
ncbi:hypothetical protein CR105_26455 [Massilia eurypsychrophila]|uniref:Phage tail protein n=1 Tax=Massilia eurypsychrophila TaxID=1485217 RepID=A0A2G8T7L6_9BURK|nr:hypothetical protein [Massilia eurypsychrophila]PIL42040.1 hypothetical protein CR105_26455 [Massilia eurypsychrophila]